MKKKALIAMVLLGLALLPTRPATAQIEIIGEAIKAAIMAIDLGVQRLQTQTIFLQDAQKEMENAMAATHLTDITNWVQQQKDLYSEYYNELWQVKSALTLYSTVKDMIGKQAQIVSNYKKACAAIRKDPHFSAAEVGQIISVYDNLLNQSIANIGQLTLIINSFITQMGDGDRLHQINTLGERIDRNYYDLQTFSQENVLLSLQRSKSDADIQTIKSLYGIQ
jgi:enamine deaminase RidA (YjgF/YER057c/UK114 family)